MQEYSLIDVRERDRDMREQFLLRIETRTARKRSHEGCRFSKTEGG
jgi:hypothetical protein